MAITKIFCTARSLVLAAGLVLLPAQTAFAQEYAILSGQDIHHPVFGAGGMVATQEAIATRVGADILRQGGNAVDAAVAVGFALAVTLPRAGNLGGGGFMMVHMADTSETVAIDYRETAPAAAVRDMYLDDKGEVDKKKARYSHHSVGVPGSVAGMALALEKYGTISLDQALAPAIKLAKDGFAMSRSLAANLEKRRKRFSKWPQTMEVVFKADGSGYQPGELFRQADLATSLTAIAEEGPSAFYTGAIAEKIVAEMEGNGGLITKADLAAYKAVIRKPVSGSYRGYTIKSMPPPSSGGVHLVQILNILSGYDLRALGHNSAASIHRMSEAMKLAYADRSKHLGDPDYWPVPVKGLTSPKYADQLRGRINLDRATPSSDILPGDPAPNESNETTHYSIMDRFGNAVSNTYTINFSFGTGIIARGTGIFLNNEMDDFSAKPGTPNAYGLLGGEANAVEAGKRPLSSMTPTLVLKDGAPVLATGSPGGSRIITTVLQVISNIVDHQMNPAEAVAARRVHHQWLPDEIRIEKGLNRDTVDKLHAMGHETKTKWAMGSAQTVQRIQDGFLGVADPRRPGALALGVD